MLGARQSKVTISPIWATVGSVRYGRCVVITIDPVTTERDPAIYRTAAADRQGRLGVYGTTVEPGRVALHDPVLLAAFV